MRDRGGFGRAGSALQDTAWELAAQVTVLACGLVIMGTLSRGLGPSGYGQYAVLITVLCWVEFGLSGFFSRAVIKAVADSEHWEPVARTALRGATVMSCAFAALLAAVAWPLAVALGMGELAWLMALIAIDIPIFLLSQIYLQVFAGLRSFRGRAIVIGVRAIARLGLVLVVVSMGGGVVAATLTWLGASLTELAIVRMMSPLRVRGERASTHTLFVSSIPLFVAAVCLKFTDGMDLIIVKSLGDPQMAGWYAGAVNLALVPAFLGMALMPGILSSVSGQRRRVGVAAAGLAGSAWLRLGFMLLPFAAIGIVLSSGLTVLVLGGEFARSADFLPLLLVACAGRVWLALATAFMAGLDRAVTAARIAVVHLTLAPVGVIGGIAIGGPVGAATGYAIASWIGVALVMVTLMRTRLIVIPWRSGLRAMIAMGLVLWVGGLLPVADGLVPVMATGVALVCGTVVLLLVLGEQLPEGLSAKRSLFRRTLQTEIAK